jgi:putative effector of murein hydrolase
MAGMLDALSSALAPWRPLLESPLFMLTLSVAAFQLASLLYRRCGRFPLLHPSVTGAIAVAAVLFLFGLDYRHYASGVEVLGLLLGTATVALAIPLYYQLPLMRSLALPLAITVLFGAAFAALSAIGLAALAGGERLTLVSILPKSITTPIALAISEELGGIVELTAGALMMTALIGITLGPLCFRLLRIEDPRVQGFTLGIAAHAMGTGKALETSAVAGGFAGLSLCLTGLISTLLLPLIARWL